MGEKNHIFFSPDLDRIAVFLGNILHNKEKKDDSNPWNFIAGFGLLGFACLFVCLFFHWTWLLPMRWVVVDGILTGRVLEDFFFLLCILVFFGEVHLCTIPACKGRNTAPFFCCSKVIPLLSMYIFFALHKFWYCSFFKR